MTKVKDLTTIKNPSLSFFKEGKEDLDYFFSNFVRHQNRRNITLKSDVLFCDGFFSLYKKLNSVKKESNIFQYLENTIIEKEKSDQQKDVFFDQLEKYISSLEALSEYIGKSRFPEKNELYHKFFGSVGMVLSNQRQEQKKILDLSIAFLKTFKKESYDYYVNKFLNFELEKKEKLFLLSKTTSFETPFNVVTLEYDTISLSSDEYSDCVDVHYKIENEEIDIPYVVSYDIKTGEKYLSGELEKYFIFDNKEDRKKYMTNYINKFNDFFKEQS